MRTERQTNAGRAGLKAQHMAARWLKRHGWRDVREYHPGPFDIQAKKKDESWRFETKSGEAPTVKIRNLLRMLEGKQEEGPVDKVALIFVSDRSKTPPLLFTLDKMSFVGLKASITKGREIETQAGKKTWRKRKNGKQASKER